MDIVARAAIEATLAGLAKSGVITQEILADIISRIEMAGDREDVEVSGLTTKILAAVRLE